MSRVPLLGPEDLSGEAADTAAWIAASRGDVPRPFAVLLHRPELARKVAELGAEVRFSGVLREDQRELAILATAHAHGCGFEWKTHRDIALDAGVRSATVAALAGSGAAPFTSDEATVIDFARQFVRDSTVDEVTFQRAHELLGVSGVVELAVVVGYYSMLACVLNTCAPGTG